MGSDLHIAMENVGYSVNHLKTTCGIDLGYSVFRWDRDVTRKNESPKYVQGKGGKTYPAGFMDMYPYSYGAW